jgi:hypothetical protein
MYLTGGQQAHPGADCLDGFNQDFHFSSRIGLNQGNPANAPPQYN